MKSWTRDHPLAAAVIGTLIAVACTAVLTPSAYQESTTFRSFPKTT
jgi:hypothetical protein